MRARSGPLRFDVSRNVDAGSYLESFLVSAVASILVIRLYLEMTDYPKLGGGGLHIAHMLWGGLLMLVAIVLLLAFLGKRVKRAAAILDGARSDEIARALALLERSGSQAGVADAIRVAVLGAARAEEAAPSRPARLAAAARRAYNRLAARRSFHRAVVLVFAGNAAATLLAAGSGLVAAGPAAFLAADNRSFTAIGHVLASIVTTAMTIFGIVRLAYSHLAAYRWFKRSVLVSIFLGQVFLFFQSQFAALGGLIVNLALLSGLNAMLRAEYARRETAASAPGAASSA